MYKFVIKRVLLLIPVIIGVTFLVYFIMSFSGDPTMMILGDQYTPEAAEALKEEMGLNDPVIIQYIRYMGNLLQGDMGTSYVSNNDVFTEISAKFPGTVKLTVAAILFSMCIAIPTGIIAAVKQYSIADNICTVLALVGAAMPSFWLGLLLILLFSLNLGLLPTGGADLPQSIILPAVAVGMSTAASIMRMTRSSMLEVIRQDYIRTARSKGVTEKVVVLKHALKNALIPVITVVGLQFGGLLGGAVIAETIFAWPGIGRLMVDSIRAKDTPVVLGCILIFAVAFSVVNLLVDILYAYVDPRIKAEYKR